MLYGYVSDDMPHMLRHVRLQKCTAAKFIAVLAVLTLRLRHDMAARLGLWARPQASCVEVSDWLARGGSSQGRRAGTVILYNKKRTPDPHVWMLLSVAATTAVCANKIFKAGIRYQSWLKRHLPA